MILGEALFVRLYLPMSCTYIPTANNNPIHTVFLSSRLNDGSSRVSLDIVVKVLSDVTRVNNHKEAKLHTYAL